MRVSESTCAQRPQRGEAATKGSSLWWLVVVLVLESNESMSIPQLEHPLRSGKLLSGYTSHPVLALLSESSGGLANLESADFPGTDRRGVDILASSPFKFFSV